MINYLAAKSKHGFVVIRHNKASVHVNMYLIRLIKVNLTVS